MFFFIYPWIFLILVIWNLYSIAKLLWLLVCWKNKIGKTSLHSSIMMKFKVFSMQLTLKVLCSLESLLFFNHYYSLTLLIAFQKMILWLTFWCGSSRSRIFFWDGSASGEKGRFHRFRLLNRNTTVFPRFKLSKLCENILSCVKIWLRWRPEPAVGEPSPASSRGARGTGRAHSRGHRLPPAGNKRTCCWKSCFNVNCKTYCMVDFPPKMVANFSYLSPSQLGKKIHYCVCLTGAVVILVGRH